MSSLRFFAQRCLLASLAALTMLASSVMAAEPAVVVSVKSYMELLTDSQYLGNSLRQPMIGLALPGLVAQLTGGNGLKGLDTTRPIGAYLTVSSDGQPKDFVVFIPLTSEKLFSETLQALFSAPTTTGMIREYQPKNGGRPIFAKVSPKHFLFAQNAEALAETPDPDKLVKSPADIAVELDLTKIGDNLKEGFLAQVDAQAAATAQRNPSETEAQYAGREAGRKLSLEAVRRLAMDGDRLSLGFNLDAKAKNVSLDLGFTAKPGTALAQACASYAKTESPFVGLISKQTVGSFFFSAPISESVQRLMKATIESSQQEQEAKLQDLPADQREAFRRGAQQMIQVAQESIQRGRWDQALVVNATESGKFQVLSAMKIAKGRDLSKFAESLAAVYPSIRFNVAEVGGARVHSIALPPEFEEAFGSGPAHVAVSEDQILFALGGDSLAATKAALEGKASKNARAPISLRIGLSKLLPLIPNADSQLLELVKSAFASGNDEIALEIASQPNGAKLRLEIQDGVLQLVGLGIQARSAGPGR